jgi:hypothetical protein
MSIEMCHPVLLHRSGRLGKAVDRCKLAVSGWRSRRSTIERTVMAMIDTSGVDDAVVQRQHVTGTLGVAVTVAVAVILGVHPFGSTGLYDDGPRFVEHVGALWVVIHFAGAVLLLAVPVVVASWAETLGAAASRCSAE